MTKFRLFFAVSLVVMLAVLSVLPACTKETPAPTPAPAPPTAKQVTLYIGGTFALTGAYAEDTAAVLAGFEDYA
jgi:hypothetical protein